MPYSTLVTLLLTHHPLQFIYVTYLCLWGAVGTRDYLLGNVEAVQTPGGRRLLSGNVDHQVCSQPDLKLLAF